MIYLGEEEIPWHAGITIKEVLEIIGVNHSSIMIVVNEVIVPQDDWSNLLIPDHAKIRIAPIISGG